MVARLQIQSAPAAVFWLLAAAWLCANFRAVGIEAALNWLSESSRFSHQQRLTLKVAELLGGEQPEQVASESAPQPLPKTPAAPSVPIKKLEAPLVTGISMAPAIGARVAYFPQRRVALSCGRAAPPHGPPRVTRLS